MITLKSPKRLLYINTYPRHPRANNKRYWLTGGLCAHFVRVISLFRPSILHLYIIPNVRADLSARIGIPRLPAERLFGTPVRCAEPDAVRTCVRISLSLRALVRCSNICSIPPAPCLITPSAWESRRPRGDAPNSCSNSPEPLPWNIARTNIRFGCASHACIPRCTSI